MKKLSVLIFAAVAGVALTGNSFPALVPIPLDVSTVPTPDRLEVAAVAISVDSSGQSAKLAADFLRQALAGTGLAVTPPRGQAGAVRVHFMGGEKTLGDEGYVLNISKREILITAPSAAGHFYGAQTLLQLFTPDLLALNGKIERAELPLLTIRDRPRFRWRGAMIDLSRHFFGPDYLKRFIDLLAMNKMNVLHLHLTDNPGWRLESSVFPRLNTIGATGNFSDSNAPPALLTKKDVRELVAYAQARFVTIVPEIDMPGHAAAATRAYPDLNGGKDTFNPLVYGPTNSYWFATNVLTEVMSLFPSQVIHFGGDEVDNKIWQKLPDADAMMAAQGIATTKDIEHYFDRYVAGFIEQSQRKPAGWDEIVSAGVPKSSVIFWWRHDKTKVRDDALADGFEMVMCPRNPCYFDYKQVVGGPGASGWKITNTVENVYNWEPMPEAIAKYSGQILGVQANLWTEHIADIETLERLTLPRLGALAEVAWSQPNRKNWENFQQRLGSFQARVIAQGYATEEIKESPARVR